jgi:hypothetical protein
MNDHRTIPELTMVVLLAAGKGTRMGRSDLVKVCFEIDSLPSAGIGAGGHPLRGRGRGGTGGVLSRR